MNRIVNLSLYLLLAGAVATTTACRNSPYGGNAGSQLDADMTMSTPSDPAPQVTEPAAPPAAAPAPQDGNAAAAPAASPDAAPAPGSASTGMTSGEATRI